MIYNAGPPVKGKSKKGIFIPAAAAAALTIAFLVLFFTGNFPFSENKSYSAEGGASSGVMHSGGGSVSVTGDMNLEFTPDKSGVWEIRTSDNGGGAGSCTLNVTLLKPKFPKVNLVPDSFPW